MGLITRGAMRPKRPKIVWEGPGLALVASYDFEGSAAQINADWPIGVTDGNVTPTWGVGESPDDGSQAAFYGLNTDLDPGTDHHGLYTAPHPFAGLTPSAPHIVRGAIQETGVVGGDNPFGFQVTGATGTVEVRGVNGAFRRLAAPAMAASAAGELTVTIFQDMRLAGAAFVRSLTVDNIALYEDLGLVSRTLYFAEPLDQARAFCKRAPGSLHGMGAGGDAQLLWHVGTDQLLAGLARWIPLETGLDRYGTTSTGWHGTDGTDGWRAFLESARDKRPFTFYPDRDNDAVSYTCQLVEPMSGPPEPEGNRHVRTPLTIRSLAGAFTGY